MNTDDSKAEIPFLAPARSLPLTAPFRWLNRGWQDLSSAPRASLSLGVIMTLPIMLVMLLAWRYGSAWIMLSMLCGFVFLAPMACVGCYAISALLERHQPVTLKRVLRACFKRYIGTQMVFAMILLVVFLVWARASSMTSIFIPATGADELEHLLAYLTAILLVSLFFLSITFTASAFSLPMIMHRDVDAVTAVVTSVNGVLRNKRVMLIWGCLIGIGMVLGIASGGLLLVPFLPLVGHAAWHAYQDTIDARQFPRHKFGITATSKATI